MSMVRPSGAGSETWAAAEAVAEAGAVWANAGTEAAPSESARTSAVAARRIIGLPPKRPGLTSAGHPLRTGLFRRLEGRLFRHKSRGVQLCGLGLDLLDDLVDHAFVGLFVGDLAVKIDHARALAAAGEADVGVEGLARAVDDAADDGQRHRGGHMGQLLFQDADGLDDIEALTGAGRAGDDVDAPVAQAERLEDVE